MFSLPSKQDPSLYLSYLCRHRDAAQICSCPGSHATGNRPFYLRRSQQELLSFYRSRTAGGRDVPEPSHDVEELIEQLCDLDRQPHKHGSKFRFLDLPAEMRNIVYDEVLPVLSNKSSDDEFYWCRLMSVLCASKQINSEAESRLYTTGVVKIGIRCEKDLSGRQPTPGDISQTSSINARMHRSVKSDGSFEIREIWPHALLKFKKLDVQVELCDVRDPEQSRSALIAANHELLGLVAFLSCSTDLRALDLTVDGHLQLSADPSLTRITQPLVNGFHSQVELTVCGTAQQADRKDLTGPGGMHFFVDFKKARALLSRVLGGADYTKSSDGRRLAEQADHMRDALLLHAFVDDTFKERIIKATNSTHELFAGEILPQLSQVALDEMKQVKKAATFILKQIQQGVEQIQRLESKVKLRKVGKFTSTFRRSPRQGIEDAVKERQGQAERIRSGANDEIVSLQRCRETLAGIHEEAKKRTAAAKRV